MAGTDLLEGKKILIVDDEPDVLETLEQLLPMCRLVKATSFKEADDQLDQQSFDLAILDIMGVDGYRLLKKANRKNITAVMLTAHALSPENVVKSYKQGAVSYIPKEKMQCIPSLLNDILENMEKGKDFLWQCWLDQLDSYFEKRFGSNWKDRDTEFKEKFAKGTRRNRIRQGK